MNKCEGRFSKAAIIMLVIAGALGVARAEFEAAPEPMGVPELLVAASGTRIENASAWERIRRPELVKIFEEEEYGVRPIARPADLTFTETSPVEECFGGRALRKRIRAAYSGPGGHSAFNFSVWIPKVDHPVSVFIHSSPRPAETAADIKGPRPVYYLPAEKIVGRGYAVIAYCNQEVALDWHCGAAVTSGVFSVYGPKDLDHRHPTEWGILSAWAWGMSRIVDWIETEPLLDAKRIGTVGLSRNGKASLVAGAFDERIAMVVSCCSGCSGAKLNHLACWESEDIIKITNPASRWFAPNYRKYRGHDRDEKMPFDQHQFLALIAPRLLYVSSASEDAWAGQRGEFAATKLASPVWNLYGRPGLIEHGFPAPDYPLHAGDVGYHLRTGLHDITLYDWQCYLDFADGHGWNLPATVERSTLP